MRKFLPYILIFVVLAGLFGLTGKTLAQTPGVAQCFTSTNSPIPLSVIGSSELCKSPNQWKTYEVTTNTPTNPTGQAGFCNVQGTRGTEIVGGMTVFSFTAPNIPDIGSCTYEAMVKLNSQVLRDDKYIWSSTLNTAGNEQRTASSNQSAFENEINNTQCFADFHLSPTGCATQFAYYFLYIPSAFLLWLSAYFFNVLISITLTSKLFSDSNFVPAAWGVVRDLSNIFFILILLYIAIKIILGMGGHDVKKMIAKVVVIALIINFSMFFTQIVIDSSNILALVFYNKMEVSTKNTNGSVRPYSSATGEKDVAGGMVNSFNPTSLLTADFFEKAAIQEIPGSSSVVKGGVPFGVLVGITLIASVLMLFAAYCFLVAGISFIGRMIELFVLIIFSPFAFMSSTIPVLSGVEYLGWDAWFKRLIKVSFMAPIFMFFMYFIFMLIKSPVFDNLIVKEKQSVIETILLIILPALVILILLLKATEFAKKGSGKFGEVVMTSAKVVGGFALAAASGGAAALGASTVGKLASETAGREGLKEAANKRGVLGYVSRMALKTADYGAKASFDLRKAPGMGALAQKTKIDMELGKKIGLGIREGGFSGMEKRKKESLEEESKLFKTKKSDKEVEELTGGKYKTAEALNHSRMETFKNNLGIEGILGSAVYSSLKAIPEKLGGLVSKNNFLQSDSYIKKYQQKYKKEPVGPGDYDESIADETNKEKAKRAKLVVGAVAAISTGGMASSALGGGVLANMTGATIGAAGAVGYSNKEKGGEGGFAKALEKEHKQMKKIEDRIKENEKLLTGLHSLLEGEKEKTKDQIVTGDKETGFKINTENIEKELANLAFIAKREDVKLKQLIDQGVGDADPRMTAVQNTLMQNTIRTGLLNKIKGAEKEERDLKKQIYDLGKDKSSAEKENESHGTPKKEPHATPAPHAPAPHAPAHNEHSEPAHAEKSHEEEEHGGDHGGGNKKGH